MFDNYPQGATNEAKRALKHREENGSKCGTNVGWNRAKQLANRESLSEADVKSIHSFLSRAKVYDQGKFKDLNGNEICGSIMFSAWGGDPMVKWAARTAANIQEQNNNNMSNIEKRVCEIRMEGTEGKRTVEGYAAVFNKQSEDLGGFREMIQRGAFKEAISISDVRALFNHDANMILARNTSGTLRLEEDNIGLKYSFEAPNTTAGNDLLEMIRRGDINQSSFGFTVEEDSWDDESGYMVRTIKKIKRLFDVSAVTYPAYPDATVALRSMPIEVKEEEKEQKEEQNEKENKTDLNGQIRNKIVKAAILKHA
jgi:HK97 family phage prohead protease